MGEDHFKFSVGMGIPVNGLGTSIFLDGKDYFTFLLGTDFALLRSDFELPEQEEGETVSDVMAGMAIPSFHLNIYTIKIGSFAVGGYYIQSEVGASAVGLTISYLPVVPGKRYDP